MMPAQHPAPIESVAEKDLLTEEIWVSRRAASITAELVVEQFQKMEEIQRRLEDKAASEKVLNSLLSLSLADIPQDELLGRALDLVLTTPWLRARAQGAILLVEEEPEVLVMKAQRSLPEPVQRTCARVRFGACLCGSAAVVRQVVFANDLSSVDQAGTPELHGAYCVPLLSSGTLLGVMTLSVEASHRRDPVDEAFLRALADVLAGVIERRRIVERLRHATMAADAANRAKSTFLANMSHELRTPLNAIIGYSEMLQEEAQDAGPPEFVADLRKIQTAGKHLLELINTVLDLSKIEAGKMELYLETFAVGDMIEAVVGVVEPLVAKHENTLEVDCRDDVGRIRTDMTKLRQALLNLLSNACKFTQHGTIYLQVTREKLSRDGASDWITFTVRDTGIGMTPQQLAKVFQPFTQADAKTNHEFGGTGLGLTITQRFCRVMGGEVSVQSAPGEGTTFVIRIPADVTAARESERVAASQAQPSKTFGSGTRLLVIDDEATARELMQRFLSKSGFSVITASSGEEGLRLARALHPDAITLDVIMPGMDGWAVLKALKMDAELADIPVIMLTIADSMELGYALGAAEYMTKPVDRDRLLTVLQNYRREHAPATVLIVEDDAITRDMLRRMLQHERWTVAEAENGRAALDWLSANQASVILLDLMMPEMDGFEFVEHWREREDWQATPILVMTAKDLTDEDRLRLSGYVRKIVQKGAYAREQLLHEILVLLESCVGRKARSKAAMKE